MERIGMNATMNSGAIKLEWKISTDGTRGRIRQEIIFRCSRES